MIVLNSLTRSNQLGLIIACLAIIGLSITIIQEISVWQHVIVVTPEDAKKDYVGKVWRWFLADPIKALFGEKEGSAPYLQYLPIGLAWMWGSYGAGRIWSKHKHVVDRLYWSSFAWCVYATLFVMGAWIWAAGVQHFQWYACTPQTIGGVIHQCYQGEQGTMDGSTHITTPGALMAILLTVNIEDVLGLRGRIGRGLALGILLGIMELVIIVFEVIESGNPAVYANLLWNSIPDMGFGTLAALLQAGWYNTCVPYEE